MENPPITIDAYGLTRRDYFAAAALQGLCANGNHVILEAMNKEAVRRGETRMSETFAREAYEAADAMIAESKKEA